MRMGLIAMAFLFLFSTTGCNLEKKDDFMNAKNLKKVMQDRDAKKKNTEKAKKSVFPKMKR